MPLWIKWLSEHWMSVLITIGVIVAIAYVINNRKLLFFKE